MNKIFFKFATFWWFCLLDCFLRFHCLMCLLSVSHFVISAWQFVTVLVWDPCSRFETFFFDLYVVTGLPSKSQAFFWGHRMTCPLFAYSLHKISEIHKRSLNAVQSILPSEVSKPLSWMQSLVQRCFTPFQTNSRHQIYGNQSELIKNPPSILLVTLTQRRKSKPIWHSTEITYWSWNIFTSHNLCSLLIEQLINLEKLRNDYLKFRTDLRDRVMVGQ